MIRKIVLENFMSHKRTVIEPADGLTVLTGPNNCGKSAVVVALQALCRNDGQKSFIRHGEREARVIVETSEGHRIEWMRHGESVSYRVNGREVGRLRGGTPEDLHECLRLPRVEDGMGGDFDIHFAEQKSPIFLINEPGRRAATFFASSSDAALLLQMQQRHREKVLVAKRDQTGLARRVEAGKRGLARFEMVPKLDAALVKAESAYESVSQAMRRSSHLLEHAIAMEDVSQRATKYEMTRSSLKALSAPPALHDCEKLRALTRTTGERIDQVGWAKDRRASLVPLEGPPPIPDLEGLRRTIADLIQRSARQRLARIQEDALASLSPLPVLTATADLEKSTTRLKVAEDAVRELSIIGRRCQSLPAPPEILDCRPLHGLHEKLIASHKQVSELTRAFDASLTLLEAASKDVRSRIAADPTCPTCGGTMDAERLLTMEAHNG